MNFVEAEAVHDEKIDSTIKKAGTLKLKSSQLFATVKEVMIEHENEVYLLRITKQNKLVLTK